jgi:O-acetyl-ADP-ribose deacetylase (regulator of RNase III)
MVFRMIEIIQGDIVLQEVDALVNAANQHLAGGGGVDGAIHRAGGPAIMKELREKYRGCPTGSAVITGAGNLKAKYVIHAVGPRWQGGTKNEMDLLASAYRTSLELARDHQCRTIAFPAISTGIYGFPAEPAARVSLQTTLEFLRKENPFEWVRFVLFDLKTRDLFERVLRELMGIP